MVEFKVGQAGESTEDADPVSGEATSHTARRLSDVEHPAALRTEGEPLRGSVPRPVEAVVRTDLDGTIRHWGESASLLLGMQEMDAIGDSLFDCVPRNESTRLFALYQSALGGEPGVMEWRDPHLPNNWRAIQVRLAPDPAGPTGPAQIITTVRDVTRRHLDEETRRRDALVLEQLQDAVVCTDPKLRVVYWNEAAERIFGWGRPEILGRSVLDRLPREVHDVVSAVMQDIQNDPRESEWEDFRKDGSRVWIQWRSRPWLGESGEFLGVVSVGTDTTARRTEERRRTELETQLFHAQRMETIGLLSTGIAHDFNNVLSAILMRSDVALADPAVPAKLRSTFEEIRSAGMRARALARRLLNFSRRDEPERELVNLCSLLVEITSFVRATLPPAIELKLDLPEGGCRATLADENRLYQVFVNLASNAAAAMPTGGLLCLALSEEHIDESRVMSVGSTEPGWYLAVRVLDAGTGMTSEIIRHMFDPFFTTKGPSEGTGLGLTIVANIVAQHGGAIQVDSAPHQGTTITVFLPVVDRPQLSAI